MRLAAKRINALGGTAANGAYRAVRSRRTSLGVIGDGQESHKGATVRGNCPANASPLARLPNETALAPSPCTPMKCLYLAPCPPSLSNGVLTILRATALLDVR